MDKEEIRVTVADVRAINFCMRGARQWFTRHGLDYTEFLTKGLPISQVEPINDALAQLVVKQARLRAAGEAE